MAKEFNGTYKLTKAIGNIGNKSVELGHYEIEGKSYDDKVYIFDHFSKRDGSEGKKIVAKLTIEEFKELKGMSI